MRYLGRYISFFVFWCYTFDFNVAFAECRENDETCGLNCCVHVSGEDGNRHAEIYKDLAASETDAVKIADEAFREGTKYGKITSVNIPEGVTEIGKWAFRGNNLSSIQIPNTVTLINTGAFNINNLTSLVIPDNVTNIAKWAFNENYLTSLTIPDSADIADDVFMLDENYTDIVCQGNSDVCKAKLSSSAQIIKDEDRTWWGGVNSDRTIVYADSDNLTSVYEATDENCNGEKHFYDGQRCVNQPNVDERVCEHEISGYVKVGKYCVSPENSYAKKHYTPAEANEWLHDGNDNFVIITFKK